VEGIRSYEGRVRRQQILSVALGLFLKHSYEGTPMSAIAEVVGITKAGLYHHFRAKEDILYALYRPSFDKVRELLDRNPTREELLEGYLGIMLENRALTTLMATDLSILARPEIVEKALELMRGLQAALVGEGADPEGRMQAECALGALRSAVTAFPEAEAEIVRRVGLRAARAVLASR
jgi:AcrR family transcriptional regulator